MRKDLSNAEPYRNQLPGYASRPGDRFGLFVVNHVGITLRILACESCEEMPWDHVSVSGMKRGKPYTPRWAEMCYVKKLFFEDEEAVMQLHPRKSEYVNFHPNCLHRWRPTDSVIPEPPSIAVGPKRVDHDSPSLLEDAP